VLPDCPICLTEAKTRNKREISRAIKDKSNKSNQNENNISKERDRKSHQMKLIKDSFNDLQEEFPDVDIGCEFEKYSDYLSAHGKQYEDYAAGFRRWLGKIFDFE
jgi:hydrogenase maturation factor